MLNALVILLILLTTSAAGVQQATAREPVQTAPADDLPAELRLLLGTNAGHKFQWTLIGTNDKARDQEKLHPELNSVHALWHCPIARDRSVLKFGFTRPIRTGANVFHMYVKADGDEKTGRKHGGIHNGVDYMFTLIDGDPNHAATRVDIFGKDGTTRRGGCNVVIREATVYLAAEMTLQQQDDRSVFEYCVSSYVRDSRAAAGLGYRRATSAPAPAMSDTRLLINPDLTVINGCVPGWQIVGGTAPIEAGLSTDSKEGALVLDHVHAPEGITQTVSLRPGHYLLRAWAKTNVFQIHLIAGSSRMPVAVSDEFKRVDLPFCIPRSDPESAQTTQLGFRYLARPATGKAARLPARLSVKRVELVRLADTVLGAQWAETVPVDRVHRLKLINQAPEWNRPGKVMFQDAFLGTELWLMTQEGQVDHTYVGHPNFSHDGKYLHIGTRRAPRGLLRTDGSTRYLNDAWTGILWLFPWEQKRLPGGADPADWIVTSRKTDAIKMLDVVTGRTHQIDLPARAGWQIVHFPGIASYGGRGPNMRRITHETLVWLSGDKRSVGRSNVAGEGFTTYPVRSISSHTDQDQVYANMSSVGGKAGDNWRDALDRDGNRYFLFEINREHFPNHPTNPYQVWALSLSEGDRRGLLRVMFHPRARITEFVSSQSGMTPQPSANWWNHAAGFPWSGDNGILLLEDGTLVHMSSLGMHSSFAGGSTVSVNCVYTGEVGYVGTYPRFDRVSWPHEFLRDADDAVVASHAEPVSPLVMIDLAHRTMWTLAFTNFHDYAIRYKTRWNASAYHKPMFRPAPGFSPDFTKVVFFSSMLTGDRPDRKWGDVYVAVARYPEPPLNVRRDGAALVWDTPRRHAELEGFRLYHSGESGRNYARVGEELMTGTRWQLPGDAKGFHVLTSVEKSGLESRTFSNEACVGGATEFRHFYRPAAGKIAKPMVPFFEPAGTGDGYAVAITDPDMIYREALTTRKLSGSVAIPVSIPAAGAIRILGRVRSMTPLERASYTTGWPMTGAAGRGGFTIRIAGRKVGVLPVKDTAWRWIALDTGAVPLAAGAVELEMATQDAGIAIDHLLLTNDPNFTPRGRGQVPEELAAVPQGLRAVPFAPEDMRMLAQSPKDKRPRVKLVWNPVNAPQGVSHYNVYRSDHESFEAEAETLLSSPSQCVFHDVGLEPKRTVYYRVRAVDAWGNRSSPSAAVTVTN